jgi:hypothetical protein
MKMVYCSIFLVYRSVLLVYCSVFWFITQFFGFHFFKFFQKLNSLNCNRPIFDESAKLVQTGFVSFHENRLIFNNIAIHACASFELHITLATFFRENFRRFLSTMMPE